MSRRDAAQVKEPTLFSSEGILWRALAEGDEDKG